MQPGFLGSFNTASGSRTARGHPRQERLGPASRDQWRVYSDLPHCHLPGKICCSLLSPRIQGTGTALRRSVEEAFKPALALLPRRPVSAAGHPRGWRGLSFVKMAWANGATLCEFLEDSRKNAATLGRLADALAQLVAYLQKEGIAHGDLQSGNMMVSRDGSSVQLIDFRFAWSRSSGPASAYVELEGHGRRRFL